MKIIYSLFLILVVLASCTKEQAKKQRKLSIVTTTGMLADGVKQLLGDHVEITSLMGTGVDPHLYKATYKDLSLLQDADIILYNGLHLEGKMSDILEKMKRKKKVIAITDGLPKNELRILGENTYDPHIWFDVALWKKGWGYVSSELAKDSSLHTLVQKNEMPFFNSLDSLNKWVKQEIAGIPAASRVLVTAHDAFGYFGRAYNMEVIGLQGISTVSDFGLKDIADLVNVITERKIKSVFIETSVSPKAIEAVVEGCQRKGHHVQLGTALYSDAMGASGTPEGTYEGMVRANVLSMTQGLK
jgi:manganese/zinc/iron transport system substrate-binding protein